MTEIITPTEFDDLLSCLDGFERVQRADPLRVHALRLALGHDFSGQSPPRPDVVLRHPDGRLAVIAPDAEPAHIALEVA